MTSFTQTCPPGPQVVVCRAAFQAVRPQSIVVFGWCFTLTFVEFPEVSVNLLHQLAKMSLNSSSSFYSSSQSGVTGTLTVILSHHPCN